MATLNEKTALRQNPHLLDRITAALATAAEDVRNEQADFTALASSDVFSATAHGYSDGDKIEFAGASLPTGLTAATAYFVRDKTTDTFKVAATSDGTAIDLTGDGYGQVAVEHHPARFAWASEVLLVTNGPRSEAKRAFWLVIQNETIADGYTGNPTTGGATTDNDVQFVVNGLVNILAGAES